MTGKTHETVGLLTLGCIAYKFPDGINLLGIDISPTLALITAAAGSYLPDIDLQQSHLGHKYKFISKHLTHRGLTHKWYVIPLALTVLLFGTGYLPLSVVRVFNIILGILMALSLLSIALPVIKYKRIDLIDGANGLLLSAALSALATDLFGRKVMCSLLFGVIFGWLMHIFADLFNEKGVPLLPGCKKMHIMCVQTKSCVDKHIIKNAQWQEPVWLACYCTIILLFTLKEQIL